MAGGEHHHADGANGGDFRAKVWSMSGVPYCRPKHWKLNTAFAMFGIVLICIPITMSPPCSSNGRIFLFAQSLLSSGARISGIMNIDL